MWNTHIPSNKSDIAIIIELEALLDIKPVKSENPKLHPDIIRLLEEFLHNGLPFTLITGYELSIAKSILGKSLKSLSIIGSYGAETEISGAIPASLVQNSPISPEVQEVHCHLSNVQNAYPEAKYELTRVGARIFSETHPQKLDEIYSELISMASSWGNDFRLIKSEDTLELTKGTHNYGIAITRLMAFRKLRPLKPCFIGCSMAAETGFLMSNILDGISINLGDTDNSHAKFQINNPSCFMDSLITLSSAENMKTKNEIIFNLDLIAA